MSAKQRDPPYQQSDRVLGIGSVHRSPFGRQSVTFKPKYWTVEAVLIMAKSSINGALGTEGTPPRQFGTSFVNGSGSVISRIVLVLPLLLQPGLDLGWILAAAQIAHDAGPVDFRLGRPAIGRSMVDRGPGCRGIGWLGKQV